jgi:methyl-accepting chemotaxis protein
MAERSKRPSKARTVATYVILCTNLAAAAALLIVILTPVSADPLRSIITPVLVFSALLSLSAVIVFHFFMARPLHMLQSAQEILIGTDFKSLSIAVSELARGNLTIQTEVSARPLEQSDTSSASDLIGQYDRILEHLRESVQDLNTVTAVPCNRICYVGADSYREGEKCGAIMGELLGGTGSVAILTPSLTATNHKLRRKGFQNELATKFPGIRVVAVREENEDPTMTKALTLEMASRFPELAGIYVTEGGTPYASAEALVESGQSKRIKIVAHDLSEATMKHLARGTVSATLSQNPFAQGHDPAIHLHNYLISGKRPAIQRMTTTMDIVTPGNFKEFWSEREGLLLPQSMKKALAVPIDPVEGRAARIGIIIPIDTGFWKAVVDGAKSAVEELRRKGTELIVEIPEFPTGNIYSAESFKPIIQSLIDRKIHALALPVFDRNLVSFLNDAIREGIAVATLNAEPVSFRGMVEAMAKHAQSLLKMSGELADGSGEASMETARISETMKSVLNGTRQQLASLERTSGMLESLRSNIGTAMRESSESLGVAEETSEAARAGHDTVHQGRETMRTLEKTSESTMGHIANLNAKTIQIGEIVSVIDEVAAQTNILAINAAIQAARAGAEGKGFSVVASEIRKLAAQSSKATKDIKELIQAILSGVLEAMDSMTQSLQAVRNSAAMSERAESALKDILGASTRNREKIKTIDLAVTEIRKLSDDVGGAMASLESINKINASDIEATSASTERINREVAGLNNLAGSLAALSRAQEDLITQFVLEKDT